MTDLFLKVVNLSFSASWVVLAVLAARFALKKAPRWIHVFLWGLVTLRLLCPFSPESALSLVPSAEVVSPEIMTAPEPTIHTGIDPLNLVVNEAISENLASEPGDSANPLQIWIPLLCVVWLLGMAAMAEYTLLTYNRLCRRVKMAIRVNANVYLSEHIPSPFVLGVFRPRIYLPYGMTETDMAHVIAHERTHIRRKDHWWKPLGFALLTINWFNPLMWVAYILLCRDIEMACDEKVVRDLAAEQKKAYSAALLSCSINPRQITACPLAFGEVGVKQRIKSVLSYKKPAFWVILVTAAVAIALAMGLLTNPKSGDAEIRWDSVLYIQEGRAVKTLPEDAAAVGALDSILVQEIGQPEYHHPDQNGQAVHLDKSYTGQPLHLADGVLYLMEPGGKSWLPFVAKHTTLDVYDLLQQDVQCNFVLRGSEVSISEFLSDDSKLALRELLDPASLEAQPTLGWTWEMNAVNYVEDICFVIDNRDFTRHALLTRREEGWLMVYWDEGWAVSAWTFQSPELDAFIAPWQGELAFHTELFAPFATAEDPIYLAHSELTMLEISARWAVPAYSLGTVTTDTHWERQASVSYEDRTIRLMCRPFERGTWMNIRYFDSGVAPTDYPLHCEPLTLANGTTGKLYHSGDPARWGLITLDTTRGQLLVELDTTHGPSDWAEADYRMALAILSTLSLTENGNSLFGDGNPLGLTGRLENVTPSGATLIVDQDGTLWDRIITGSMWMLEKQVDGEWVSVMPEFTAWTSIAYLMEPGTSSSFHLNWSQIVGELGPGRYRVSKHFTGERSPMFTLELPTESQDQMVWVEFTIE